MSLVCMKYNACLYVFTSIKQIFLIKNFENIKYIKYNVKEHYYVLEINEVYFNSKVKIKSKFEI